MTNESLNTKQTLQHDYRMLSLLCDDVKNSDLTKEVENKILEQIKISMDAVHKQLQEII